MVLVGALAASASAAPPAIYVAPNGNDLSTGAGLNAPVATLPRALARARQLRPAPGETVEIILRAGTYYLDAPLALEPEDSGLVLSGFGKELPVISGGAQIVGWQPAAENPNIWRVIIPAARDGQWPFHELFVNGQRRQRARLPKTGFFRINGYSPSNHPTQLPVPLAEFNPAWAARGDVELVALQAWAQNRNQIRSVDAASGIVSLSGPALPTTFETNGRFFLENVPDSLAPGEWYLDSRTGAVNYWPMPGEDVPQSRIVAPRLLALARLQGSSEHPVRHVVFRGLIFADTDWPLMGGSDLDLQASIESKGAVQAEWIFDCAIERCVFTRLGGYAVDLGAGCERDQIVGNEMFDLGAGGVRLGDTDVSRAYTEPTRQNIIIDNHIHDIGRVNVPGMGILVLLSGQNLIAHNEIHHTGNTAISIGWSWGYGTTPCRENIVEFNHLHHLGQGMSSDMGGVYTLGVQPGTIVRQNLIHDVNHWVYGGWGLYLDEGSTGILLESNIVYRCQAAGFHQHYGRENLIRNNIFALNKEIQLGANAHATASFFHPDEQHRVFRFRPSFRRPLDRGDGRRSESLF